ncbi:MAG: UDP-N-acetylmuramoyl-tripeptide--D-alanyl-D-alanine ligase [Ferruginibacter sp.]|nr:UDP-N-acetylmuramoyl-tripeptide--D-alanyl-D-alanine ligase [Ferruginibacter sp.]
MEINELYQHFKKHPSVQTDSRKIKKGDLFFALKGPNFNGNKYAQQALDDGAVLCIVDEETGLHDSRIIKVNDSLETLQALAKKHREQFSIPFIAITGSNGKTTTKELVHVVLSMKYITYTTTGNLNNHIGIPLTILSVKPDAEMAVIEMGANHQHEIEGYCKYALPTHGLITNCGKAHLEGFGGEEGVKKGKGELFDYLRNNNGTAFIFNDYGYLSEMSKGISNIITYGTIDADLNGEAIKESGSEFLRVKIGKGVTINEINTQLVGGYNLPNVLAAVCIGKTFGVDDEQIIAALENYIPSNSRSQLIEKDSNRIILDAYNANPSSMKAAIENFANMPGNKKVLMLGGMMELGDESMTEHENLVKLINQNQWHKVVLVGKDYKDLPVSFIHFYDVSDARNWFREQHFMDALILVKGSRSMQMEKVLE